SYPGPPARTPSQTGVSENCAYNLPRAQAWWAIGYHNPNLLYPLNPTNNPPSSTGANPRFRGCTLNGQPGVPPNRECFPLSLRVTQMQFANTHPGLPSNPPGGAADTGPLVNTVGAYEQAGVDATRLLGGNCPE